MSYSKTFQERLRKSLAARGASVEFLRKTGFSKNALHKWMNGESSPSLENLEKIAEGLGQNVLELLDPRVDLSALASPAAREIVALLPAADQAQATDDVLQALRARLGLPVRAVAAEKKKQGHR